MWKMWLSNTLLVTWICCVVSRVSRLGEINQPWIVWWKYVQHEHVTKSYSFIYNFSLHSFPFFHKIISHQYTLTHVVSTNTSLQKAAQKICSIGLFSYAHFLHLHIRVCLISLSALSHSGWTPLWVHRRWAAKPRPFLLLPCTCITARPRGNTLPQGQPTHKVF